MTASGGGVARSSDETSGYATMVHGRGCNPHHCTTTFANVEITSLWRHNSETIRDRQKRRPHHRMKSSELHNGENRIAVQLLQNRKLRQWWRHILGSRRKLQKMTRENFSRYLVQYNQKSAQSDQNCKDEIVFWAPKPVKIQVLGVTQPPGVAQPLYSRGHN